MKKQIFGTILTILLLSGCTNETTEINYDTLIIKGTKITCFNSPTRSYLNSSLPVGSSITFYSQGGIQADELLFSYNGNNWEGNVHPVWGNIHQQANTISYYPPLYRNHQSFYQEGALCDQLYAPTITPYGNDIHLSFQHLFSHIIFDVSSQLNSQVKQIEFIPSQSVIGIIPETGEVSCEENTIPLMIEKNNNGIYDFLIPPTTLSIAIRIHTNTGEIYESMLNKYTFSSGHEYTCPIKRAGENPGISTVEDFIAFTHLINGENYENRSLTEFGEKIGENMTYYLLNDLTFTKEESDLLQMIGIYGSSTGSKKILFNDIFDGQGHTLNNLQFEKVVGGYYYSGLFSGLSTTGIIRNLIINQAVYNSPNNTDRASFLAGINKGKIENCRIQNSSIENIDKNSEFGSISSRNEGIIINCHVNQIYLKKDLSYGNGITRYNYGGKIMNCAVTNCNFNKAQSRGGLICNKTQNGEIQNCYLKGNTGNYYAISLQAEESNIIRCCYYPQSDTRTPVGNNYVSSPSDSLMKYGTQQSITEETLPQILNQWVRGSGTQQHPNFSFCLWEKGESLPAVLVSP